MDFLGKPFEWVGCSFNDIEKVVKETYPNIRVIIHIDTNMRCYRIISRLYIGNVYKVKASGTTLYVGLSADMRFYDMVDIFARVLSIWLSNDEYHRPLSRNANIIYNDIKTKCKAIATVDSQNILKEIFGK